MLNLYRWEEPRKIRGKPEPEAYQHHISEARKMIMLVFSAS
jgi:hypothetical protein